LSFGQPMTLYLKRKTYSGAGPRPGTLTSAHGAKDSQKGTVAQEQKKLLAKLY
jgi:hypothetical protein